MPHVAFDASPAEGCDLHIQAPHIMADGTVGGPFHPYCKGISDQVLQCLLFKSTDPKAKLVGVAEVAAKTDGIFFNLWHDDQIVPDERVSIPNSVGHKFRTK